LRERRKGRGNKERGLREREREEMTREGGGETEGVIVNFPAR